MMRWEFPLNNNAGEQGPNDEGMQNFRGKEYNALAREICQNSLDAHKNNKEPVIVEFERTRIGAQEIPDVNGYRNHLKKCREYWSDNNGEVQRYLRECYACIDGKEIYVLRISDYNTTGLSGPYADKPGTDWKSLVKISGAGNKSGESGGSYGIGKKAAYLNSGIRMVFYRTLTKKITGEGLETASQGVVRSITFQRDENDRYSTTIGTGYYGKKEHNEPVPCIDALENLNVRNEIGTDIFIYGLKSEIEGKKWDEEIVKELLSNFILAIYEKQLIVKIKKSLKPEDKIEIEADKIEFLLEKYGTEKRGKVRDAKMAYQVLCSEKTITETCPFHGMGNLKLRLLFDSESELNGKILVARKSKMTLFYLTKSKIDSLVSYTGILELEGEKLNEFFRELETPAHDEWKPSLHKTNRKLAREYYREIIKWIQQNVRKYGYGNIETETNVEGLSEALLEMDENEEAGSKRGEESLDTRFKDIEFTFTPQKAAGNLMINVRGDKVTDGKEKIRGNLSDKGKNEAVRIPMGERIREKRRRYKGMEDENGKDRVLKKNLGQEIKTFGRVKIIKVSDGEYRLNIIPGIVYKNGLVELNAIGENGKGSRLRVSTAVDMLQNRYLECRDGRILVGAANEKTSINLKIVLEGNQDYAMEVKMYVNR